MKNDSAVVSHEEGFHLLIPVFIETIHGERVSMIDARGLHRILGVSIRFKTWIAQCIAEYRFVESKDFILVTQNGAVKTKRRYCITLEMAKILSRLGHCGRGEQVRRYFIEYEKKLAQLESLNTELQDELARDLLLRSRFDLHFDMGGRMVLRELEAGVHLPVNQLAEKLLDHDLVPGSMLPDLLQAISRRLGAGV